MTPDFLRTTLGGTGLAVHRLGLSGTYRPGRATIFKALDEGLNYFFCYGIDTQMHGVLRDVLRYDRERYVVATGAYNLVWGHTNLRRTLEKRLRQLRTEYIDVFLFLGVMKPNQLTGWVRDELMRFREEGKARSVGISTHNRAFGGELAAQGALDVLMARYNAAHRGAESEIFPFLAAHNTGLVGYTATRWRRLLRRPGHWPKDAPVPSAGMCYRFVLSNPRVSVCMTAPSNRKQFEDNLAAVRLGPLCPEEMDFMRAFGDAVRQGNKWFI